MTAMDDALNSSTPAWTPPKLTVEWQEQFPNLKFTDNPDAVNNFSSQMSGVFTVEHSIDDGLPDPVTMTTSADASGKAVIELNGRQGITAASIGWRTSTTDSGTADTSILEVPLPADIQYGDYIICAVTVNSSSVELTDYADPDDLYPQWELLTEVSDGASLKLMVFGKQCWGSSEGGFSCNFSVSVNYSAVMLGAYARAADSRIWVDFDAASVQSAAETSVPTVIPHTAPALSLTRRGFGVSVWATGTAAGPFTYTGSGAELVEITTPIDLMAASTAVINPGSYTVTANTTAATAVVAMATIGLEVVDRPMMDARQFFSPFNPDSPIYGWDRDTADTELLFNVLTASGPEATILHKGLMEDIGIKGRQAEMKAVSKTRIDLDKSLALPRVYGDRENCSIDWLVTWVMARGGQWVGPAPSLLTRYWAPMYGSVHAHYDSPHSYGGALYCDTTTATGFFWWRPPTVVEGPFLTAMYAQQTATRCEEIIVNVKLLHLADPKEIPAANHPGEEFDFSEQFSKAGAYGRVTFWLRGDAVQAAPSYLLSSDDLIYKHNIQIQDSVGTFLGWVIITIKADTRYLTVWMGSVASGSGTVTFSSLGAFPTDGDWHFVGVAWDFAGGAVKVKIDAGESSSTYWLTNGYNGTSQLPDTDASHRAAGGVLSNDFRAHVPISDFLYETGYGAYGNPWSRHYPADPVTNLNYEGSNATMRPTYQPLQAVVEAAPIQGWEVLAQLAQSSLSSYRINEEDNLEFLPLSYFGEAEQLTPVAIMDTEVNTADLDVTTDPTKTRNVVTTKFNEFRILFQLGTILGMSTAVEIPRGTSTGVFTLDGPAVDFWKQNEPFSTYWTLTNLTASQISTPSLPWVHYMTVNTAQDGTGSVLSAESVTAKIVAGDSSTITIEFTNKTPKSAWLANDGEQVPFLRILGIPVTIAEGYTTQRDAGSVGTRRERALSAELPWIQDRATAVMVTQLLVTALARPRREVEVVVMADPRRRPGQLVTLKDSQGTQAEGTWRILSVKHDVNGPQYTQNLRLTFVPPVGVWDESNWDEVIWSE